jgi:RNA polymerase sigma-70 factor (ECF subfamily)
MNDDIKPDSVDPGISAGMGLEEPDSNSTEWVRAAIELHEGALLRYAQHFVRDLESARDIVQDTFLQLCRQTNDEIRPRVAQWLFTVCRNRAIDVCRKERRMKLAPEDQLADKLAQNSEASELQPSAAMEREEAATGLMSQISKLPDRQQEVLRLKFNAGLSYKEIAEVTGLTSSNVGFILHTAIAKLRQSLVPAS